jgi:hypothetical protein
MGTYENARGAYETAAEKYPGTIFPDAETRCKDNMAEVKRKRGNPDAEVGFQRHGMDSDKSLFYPLVQASLGDDMPISDLLDSSSYLANLHIFTHLLKEKECDEEPLVHRVRTPS